MGHLTPFLHLSNKLAKRGHRISFFVPIETQAKLEHFNLHPHLLTFIPLTVHHVDGLPPGAETSSDVPLPYNECKADGKQVKGEEEDGLFTKEAVRVVMDEKSEISREVRASHAKFRTLFLGNNLEWDNFCVRLKDLLTKS